MRHNRDDKRFNRTSGHLRCMMANMTADLLRHERVRTTTPKAKELRRYADKMITLGKDGSLHARRRAFAFLRSKSVVTKLFADLAPRFTKRKGGYTRLLKVGVRSGDAAPMSIVELVEGPAVEPSEAPAKKKAAKPREKKPQKEASAKGSAVEKKESKAKTTAKAKSGDDKKVASPKKAASKPKASKSSKKAEE